MCGRFTLTNPGEIVDELLHVLDDSCDAALAQGRVTDGVASLLSRSRYNLAPTQEALVIRRSRREGSDGVGIQVIDRARWGLRRSGSTAPLINARAESLAERPVFRQALEHGRCLVPSDGFYEWHQQTRQPFHLELPESQGFAFAGLLTPGARREPPHFCILTTQADGFAEEIHDRVPFILRSTELATWLGDHDGEALRRLLAGRRPRLVGRPVSDAVNRVAVDEPRLLDPVARAAENLSLF